ncbi:hypothetical protein RPPS3_30260 [Rhodopseudomonas palustris]|uniref:AAA family ATPase n=1 Tax=Rhodopseudomonas palustris TaxID=1076 RepID=UPI000D21F8F3|nr:AAA family ATPase [Rhodopseudomonas palustris]AVT77088.1 hypothetical protein RPPS3_30260 [Rhodopseudomonas palustris]
MKIRNIQIKRFKRLDSVNFDVDGVNILVGGNNSGKSTIIQAVHFAFTLFQSLSILNKWPAKDKTSLTISPTELIYIPSEDPYSLGHGGRLLEDADRSISITFTFDNGEELDLTIRKGRITNLLVAVDNTDSAKSVSKLDAPYSVFSPGLAGVSRTENYVSDGVLLRALARGDANIVLRNILYRLHSKPEWSAFEDDLALIFPSVRLEVVFNSSVDQYITVSVAEGARRVPLDLAGTGLLQSIQILSYFHLFAPKLIILDEPDSHLHPNNQRLLCSLLSSLSIDRDVQVMVTTHSRHVIDTMYNDAKILWVRSGAVETAQPDDQVDILLELGALDIKEKISEGKYKAILLTEDRITNLITFLLRNSGFDTEKTAILPYNGVTTPHLLKPLVRQIKDISKAAIIVHRDRDYLTQEEVDEWKKEIRKTGAEPFVTAGIDVEGYFCTKDFLSNYLKDLDINVDDLMKEITDGEHDEIISSYVNGRVDVARKLGTIGQINYGKLSAEAAKAATHSPFELMKGKRRLAKVRRILRDAGVKFDLLKASPGPKDADLGALAKKIFGKDAR